MVLRYTAALLVSYIVTFAVGKMLIPALRRIKAEQSIRQDGPVWHNAKQGTPTMGGIMFIAGVALACLIAGFGDIKRFDLTHVYVFLFALAYAAVGFFDDYTKLKKKQNLGLIAKHKFLLQLVIAALFILVMRLSGNLTLNLYIPFINIYLPIPEPIYYIFAAFVVVGTVNAVNITDGVDGLAAGVTVPVAVCFTIVSILWRLGALGVFAASLVGGLLAFLYFNLYPAKIFMGDTGAQFLGGAVCAMAFAADMPLILLPLGIVYFVETLSDIIQVAYFKLTHGKRVFKMAPLHHHFEMSGWSERKIFAVFTLVSAVFAVISYFGVRFR